MGKTIQKKPQSDLIIRLAGPGVKPWAVPLRQLNRVLGAVQRLVEQRETDEETEVSEDLPLGPGRTLTLLGVKVGSAAYAVGAQNRDATFHELKLTQQSVANPSSAEWTPARLSSVEEISSAARALGCWVEFREVVAGKKFGDVIATIGPDTYSEVSRSAFIVGSTSVYARIERVGGAQTMFCGIRLASQPARMVMCRVSDEGLVRKLGQYMYQEVFLSGHGMWLRSNRMLKKLTIVSVEPPKTGSFTEALKRIHDAGGFVWDQIPDPRAAIAELRGR